MVCYLFGKSNYLLYHIHSISSQPTDSLWFVFCFIPELFGIPHWNRFVSFDILHLQLVKYISALFTFSNLCQLKTLQPDKIKQTNVMDKQRIISISSFEFSPTNKNHGWTDTIIKFYFNAWQIRFIGTYVNLDISKLP